MEAPTKLPPSAFQWCFYPSGDPLPWLLTAQITFELDVSGITQDILFCVWLLSFDIALTGLISAAACGCRSFILEVVEYSFVWIPFSLLICALLMGMGALSSLVLLQMVSLWTRTSQYTSSSGHTDARLLMHTWEWCAKSLAGNLSLPSHKDWMSWYNY